MGNKGWMRSEESMRNKWKTVTEWWMENKKGWMGTKEWVGI